MLFRSNLIKTARQEGLFEYTGMSPTYYLNSIPNSNYSFPGGTGRQSGQVEWE
jgi:hypothetical protein